MFRHRPLALRIAKTVGSDSRSVALLGQFGAGKSSILNTVRAELDASNPTVVVASLDAWAVPSPEDVPRLALNQIVSALDRYVDTTELRRLPVSYQRLAAAEPTGRLASALGIEVGSDSVAELERLNPILEALDANLVLIVEDVERAGDEFDTRHLARLLWALRSVGRSSFVLAVDPAHARLDFPKLCDTIELVPPLDVKRAADILTAAYAHWSTQHSDIGPHTARDRSDKLQLEYARQGGMLDYMRRTGRDTPLDALVELLQTPRSLKHVLRRVDDTWQHLHGEAELDDIVIVSALRHGAQPAYEFLVMDIDAARHKPADILLRTKAVKAEWDALIQKLPSGPAVQKLVDLMGIEQLSTARFSGSKDSPQGVHISEPVDYFRRIVAGELAPGEIPDQQVLGDIDRWSAGLDKTLTAQMLESTQAEDDYVSRWEHFSDRHSEDQLIKLTDELVSAVLARDGSLADPKHPAIIALWRRCIHRIRPNERADWLRDLILRAVPVSIRMVNGLFYFWAGDRGLVNGTAKVGIRNSIVQAIRTHLLTQDDVARVLPKDRQPYELGRLIAQTGANPRAAAFEEWRDHLAPILIEGGLQQPDIFLPELANLAGDRESSIVAATDDYPPIFSGRYKIDRPVLLAMFGDGLDDALRLLAGYQGENPYAARAVEDASRWLTELEAGESGM
jgi:hypothetical protein